MNSHKMILTVAVTGAFGDRSTPNLPITPREIADSALEAYRTGASVAHIHVRDVKTGAPSMKFELYQEVVQRIRDHSDMLINLSTGAGARFAPTDRDPVIAGPGSTLCAPEKRIEHVLRLSPEICSLDVGSLNFGEHVFVNCLPHIEKMAELIKAAGIKPEIEVFDLGHIAIAKHLIENCKIGFPPLFQLCMGVKWGIPATARNMILMKDALPADAAWGAFGIGVQSFPMLTQSALLGGNVRLGMEDNLFLKKGKRARTNQELVEKAAAILQMLEIELASPSESRKVLSL